MKNDQRLLYSSITTNHITLLLFFYIQQVLQNSTKQGYKNTEINT